MMAVSLRGVIAQRLLKTVDGKRCAALEILSVTPAFANLIREGKSFQIPSIIQAGKGEGMQLMDQAIGALPAAKRLSIEQAQKFAVTKSSFQLNSSGGISYG
ncbi:MAG TPA: hypothetical protein VFG95_03935 [Nitrospiria bacterium]|nr:hypothetical protein [Nitrospiria bacterium]